MEMSGRGLLRLRLLSIHLAASLAGANCALGECLPGPVGSDRRGPAGAVVAQADWVFLATGAAIESIDVSDPWRPARRARIDLPKVVRGLHGSGNVLVAESSRALEFLSIETPEAPVVLGRFLLPASWAAQRIAVAESFVYVATSDAGLRVLDFSNPGAVVEVGHYDTPWAIDVVVRNARAFLSNTGGLTVLDVSNPAQPRPVAQLPGASGHLALSPSGTRLANFGGGCPPHQDCGWLYLVDVSNPDQPVERSRTDFDQRVADVEFGNGLAYLAESTGNGWILNVSDLGDPRIVGDFETARPKQLALRLPFFHVADAGAGLRVLRSLAPDETQEISLVPTPGPTTGGFLRNALATTVHDRGLRIFDLVSPADPSLVGERWPGVDGLYDLEANSTHAFVAAYGQGIRVYDLEDPRAPRTVAVVGPRYASALSVQHGRLLTNGEMEGGARLYDIADPEQPLPLGLVAPVEGPTDNLLSGELALVAQAFVFGSLSVHDVSEPLKPVRLAYLEDLFPRSLHAFGPRAIYTHWGGFTILDLSDPAVPEAVATFPGIEYGNSVAVYGSRGFLASEDLRGNAWLQVVDLSDPRNPVELYTAETAGTAKAVFAGPGVVVVADGDAGITVFETCVAFADGFESGETDSWSLRQ